MREYMQLRLFDDGAAPPADPPGCARPAPLGSSDAIGPGAGLALQGDSDEIDPGAEPPPRPVGRADYAERQEERRERLERAADRAAAESRGRLGEADRIAHGIPLGQPILVGHHSERRHRRDLERMRSNYTKGLEAREEAAALRQAAARVTTPRAISSDDPEALEKLHAQLAVLEQEREGMKAVNTAFRARGWAGVAALPSVTQEHVEGYQRYMALGGTGVPFPPFKFTNLSANIRRIKQRIDALLAETVREDFKSIVGDGWEIKEDRDQNRLVLRFDAKPSRETLALLDGWHWSRSQRAHLRLCNPGARNAARYLAQRLIERGSPL